MAKIAVSYLVKLPKLISYKNLSITKRKFQISLHMTVLPNIPALNQKKAKVGNTEEEDVIVVVKMSIQIVAMWCQRGI